MKIIRKVTKVFLLLLALIILIIAGISLYLILETKSKWDADKEEHLSNIADYHYILIEQGRDGGKKYLNPLDPRSKIPPTRIYDRNDIIIGEYRPPFNEIIYTNDINPIFRDMILLMEDQKFYEHKGVNIERMIYLMFKNIINFRVVGGGSTISQQLAKLKFTESEQTISRKLYEFFATIEIERRYSKDAILAMYINTVYLNEGNYGFEAASQYYFNKPLRRARLIEYAILIGMLQSPKYYSPIDYPEKSRKKVSQILNRMAGRGLIADETIEAEIEYFDNKYMTSSKPEIKGAQWKMSVNKTPYINEYIRQTLLKYLDKTEIISMGLTVKTTFDYYHYRSGQSSVKKMIANLNSKSTNTNVYEAAIITIDPRDFSVINMIGGSGYTSKNQFNRAINARRQIGSLVKPFIYAYSFEVGYFPFTVMEDKLYKYKSTGGRYYQPRNYGGNFLGEITLETALSKSVNTIPVKLLSDIGLKYFRQNTRDIFGADIKVPHNLSIGLGTFDMSALDIATSFGVLASGGYRGEPRFFISVEDYKGYPINMEETSMPPIKRVNSLSESSVYFVNKSLTKVLEEGGTGYRSSLATGFSYPISAKSGTTSSFKDAWFVIYYDELVAVAWIGSDDGGAALPPGSSGGYIAARMLMEYLKSVVNVNTAVFKWERPSSVVVLKISDETGLPIPYSETNGYTEYEMTKLSDDIMEELNISSSNDNNMSDVIETPDIIDEQNI